MCKENTCHRDSVENGDHEHERISSRGAFHLAAADLRRSALPSAHPSRDRTIRRSSRSSFRVARARGPRCRSGGRASLAGRPRPGTRPHSVGYAGPDVLLRLARARESIATAPRVARARRSGSARPVQAERGGPAARRAAGAAVERVGVEVGAAPCVRSGADRRGGRAVASACDTGRARRAARSASAAVVRVGLLGDAEAIAETPGVGTGARARLTRLDCGFHVSRGRPRVVDRCVTRAGVALELQDRAAAHGREAREPATEEDR